jgi:hypothetical protein
MISECVSANNSIVRKQLYFVSAMLDSVVKYLPELVKP